MNKRTRIALAGALAAVLSGGSLAVAALSTSAQADVTVPWAGDDAHRATHDLQLFDAAGHPLTYGSVDQPIAAFATSADALDVSATVPGSVATLFLHTPGTGQSGQVVVGDASATGSNSLSTSANDYAERLAGGAEEVGAWTGEQLDGSTPYSGQPKATLSAGAVTVRQYAAAFPSSVTSSVASDGAKPVYEVRLRTSAPGAGAGDSYAAADIVVDGSTWHLYGQSVPAGTATTTALAVAPATAVTGDSVTLTASVPGATGSVAFYDGTTQVGAAQTLGSGAAVVTTPPLSAGSHTFSAVFTGNPGSFLDSSDSVTYVVSARQTTLSGVTGNPGGTAAVGTPVTLTTTVTPAVAGTVTFLVDGKASAAPVSYDGGIATTTWTPRTGGAHQVSASFAPADTASYKGAVAPVGSYTATAAPTTTTLTLSAASVTTGTPIIATATLNPAVAGTVVVRDGATVVGSATVAAGTTTAQVALAPTTIGSHPITATFTPSDAASYNPSTSTPVTVTVSAKADTRPSARFKESFPSSVKKGKRAKGVLTLVTPSGTTTTVTLYDGARLLRSVKLTKGRSATLTLPKLKKGAHSLRVVWAGSAAYKATTFTFKLTQK